MTELMQVSSLEKILPKSDCRKKQIKDMTVLHKEQGSYQIAFKDGHKTKIKVNIKSDIADFIEVFSVGCVPVMLPLYEEAFNDPNYISKEPGIYPDILNPLEDGELEAIGWYQSLWIKVSEEAPVGEHKITAELVSDNDKKSCELIYNVLPIDLPKGNLIFTQWFHADCIATYYNVEAWSEKHWELVETFIKTAAQNGINMLLTPIFTPPLDTEVGKERPTVQLVGIEKDGDNYSFDFSLLERWVQICLKYGIEYFEMAHLFTQWGAKFTPKIEAYENGEKRRIFGWDVSAADPRYECFLSQFLPAVKDFFAKKGLLENTYFHISDEPRLEHLEDYLKVKEIAQKYLSGCKIIDALSNYDFYEKGVTELPVVAINHIEPFIGNIDELWGYYCCSQTLGTSNRMIAMPSVRNRYIAMPMFKYKLKGFLQWGYNFYYTQYSKRPVNPFFETDSGGAFPSGDPFSVYPGADGALESLRIVVFYNALQDLAAMRLLESFIGHEETLKIIEDVTGDVVFSKCADDPEVIFEVRKRINEKLCSVCG